jgi:hypothetical protein
MSAISADGLIGLAIGSESVFPPNHKSELNFRMSQNRASGALGQGSRRSIPESVPAACKSQKFQCFRTIPVRV